MLRNYSQVKIDVDMDAEKYSGIPLSLEKSFWCSSAELQNYALSHRKIFYLFFLSAFSVDQALGYNKFAIF